MKENRKRRRIIRRRKRSVFLSVILIFCLSAILVKPPLLEAHTPTQCIAVIVQNGDSLWMIAERFTNNQIDIRQYINLIQEHNQMDTVNIYPGDVIEVPLYTRDKQVTTRI